MEFFDWFKTNDQKKQDFYSALKKFDEKLDQRKNTTERLWSL